MGLIDENVSLVLDRSRKGNMTQVSSKLLQRYANSNVFITPFLGQLGVDRFGILGSRACYPTIFFGSISHPPHQVSVPLAKTDLADAPNMSIDA